MKRQRRTGGVKKSRGVRQKRDANINELLKECLEKVCELQQDLQRQEDYEEDPQAAGYAACAIETLKFLTREGLPADHPMVKILTDKLMEK